MFKLSNYIELTDSLKIPLFIDHIQSKLVSYKKGDRENINQQKDEPQQSTNGREAKVRIVEHIKKNLTLFETNRQVYEISPTSVDHTNRGHLQTLLTQKQSPIRHSKAQFNQKTLSDQYTQYRASDLLTHYARPLRPTSLQQEQIASTYKGQANHREQQTSSKNQKSKTLQETQTKPLSKKQNQSKSLKRSVSSLNELLKRQLDLVRRNRSERGKQVAAQENQSKDLNQQQELDVEAVERYKVPTRQYYSSSQSLYLIPAPDPTVHIATKLVKDIILAHRKNVERAKSQPQSTQSRFINQLFGTYSIRRSKNPRSSLRSRTRSKSFSLNRSERTRLSKSSYSNLEPTLDHSVSKIRAKVKMPSGKSDKATIVDNKDGTIKISYEPKEIGPHEISLRYNDEPIEESPIVFYVDAVGSAKKKITAYGPGLTHGLVGEQCKFTINTGGLGSAKLNVTVEGPSKTQVTLNDNKDGTISVSYLPLVPGEYKIKTSFDGKQVVGSPFTTLIGDEGRQRSHINVGRGSEHSLDLKIGEDDLKALNAIIVTPTGLEEPCGLKLLKSGQLAIVFTPREQGDHTVSVRRQGNHIAGSPFKFDVLSRDIGDAKQVKVSGKNIKEGKTNAENEIIINTKEAGYGGLSVSLEGPGRSEITSKEATDGTIKLFYKPSEPGQYSLMVKYADHVVSGSPFNIKVTGAGSNPQKDSIKKFRKVANIVDINQECHFSFKLPGVSAYDLSARIHSPQGNAEDVSIKDKGDYIYQVTFVPKEVGLYSLSIRNKDIHTAGSPFPFTVGPLIDSGSHKVRCGGPGLIRGACGKLNEFNVFTREAGAGELTVIVEGPSKPELSYTDRKDGSCHVGYKVADPGEYRVSVLFNDQEVPDSPFRAFIMPLTGEVSKIELGPLPPENMIQLNKPCNLTVIMNGAKGNIEGKVRLPSGKMEDCFASPIDAENWGVRFIPREIGIYQIHIKFNKGSSHIPQSPIFIRVGHDNADPAAVVATGNGLKGAIVNHATDFTIETCNAGHALLEVNVEGPSKVSMGCAEIDEGYKVNYTPLAPGDYIISVKYNGGHIGGSPFKVHAIKQAGSRTVADAGSHEVSSISIATTDREAKQKVEHMPKFKSDASRIYCKGMGIKKAFANKPNTLTVNCSEAGFNMVYVSFLGPTRNTIHESSVKHMGGSIYEVKYTCKDRGDAILMVKYGDEQIPGSPFRLEVV